MKLRPYQLRALAHVLKHPKSALHLQPGLGKTAITIAALKELPKPALVVAPKRVIDHTWPTELSQWWPEARVQSLSQSRPRRAVAAATPAEVYLVNYELLATLWGGELEWRYPTVVLDESTKVKSHQSKAFKTLKAHMGRTRHLIELTGTPAPNSLLDLWSQLYLLDGGQRMGKTITACRERWFRQSYNGFGWTAQSYALPQITERIADLCLSMVSSDYLDLPPIVTNDIVIDLPAPARAAYDAMRKTMVATVGDSVIGATTAATVAGKLLQITSGQIYNDEGDAQLVHSAKMDALRELIEQLGAEPLLVVYQYKHELAQLRELGAVELRDSRDTIERWNSGKLPLLAIHPASAGHGLNLQHGGRHLCWTTPTYNLEHWEQANARLHRGGQSGGVIVHRIIADRTIDERIVQVVAGKGDIQGAVMEALK